MVKKENRERLLLDKKIAFDFVPSYAIATKDKALQGTPTKSPAKAGQLSSGTNNLNLAWR